MIIGLWWSSLLLQVAVCARIAVIQLWRRYPRFLGYVGGLAAESCFLLQVAHNKQLYRRAWVVTRGVLLCLELLAVIEIFQRWSASYPGIGKFGRRLLSVLLVLSTGLCVATLPISRSSNGWTFATYVMGVANRAVQSGLAAFLLLMLGFFVKFGGPVAPNLRRHTWAMTAFVGANTLGYFLAMSMQSYAGNLILSVVANASLIYWLFALKRSGETPPDTAVNQAEWEEAELLNRQMLDYADSVRQTRQQAGRK